MTSTFPAFAGLDARTAKRLVELATARGYDPQAIAAVIEAESGWNPQAGLSAWSPRRTATGLLQWIEATLRSLVGSVPGVEYLTRDWLPQFDAMGQLPIVMAFYDRYLGQNRRPVDYYLAGWGRGVGQSDSYVLAVKGSTEAYQSGWTSGQVYDINKGLDVNGDGFITVGDIRARLESKIAAAGRRGVLQLPADDVPLPGDATDPLQKLLLLGLVAGAGYLLWKGRA